MTPGGACFRRWSSVAGLLSVCGALTVVFAAPARREAHERWHRLHPPAPDLARWFMPGELGFEPGVSPAAPGARAFLTRTFYGVDNLDGGEWARRNGLGPGLRFSHNLSGIFRPELFDTHPELFALINGERSRPRPTRINWNPELGTAGSADFAAAAANDFFDSHPESLSFSVGINDALRYGDSEATRRWVYPPRYFRNMPVYSDLVFNFTNEVAARVASRHPDKLIGALAYYWTEHEPSFPLHPQVVPYLTADRSLLFDEAFAKEEAALQRKWAHSGARRLGLYDYIYGYGFLVPRIHTSTLSRHLCEARRAGFTDYFAELNSNWGLDGPQPWLVAQLLQDPEQSPRALLNEYYRRYFRSAAGPMRSFYRDCERIWAGQDGPVYWLKHYRNDSQAALFPGPARRRLRFHLDRAAELAGGDERVAARVRLVSDAFRVTERYLEFAEAREALGRAVLAMGSTPPGELPAALANLADRRKTDLAARISFTTTLAEVRAAQPYALYPSIPKDFERADWGPSADRLLSNESLVQGRELLRDSRWSGAVKPDLRMAGLLYEPGLTEGWQARTEPWQGLVAELRGAEGTGRILRLENNKTSAFEQGVVCPATGEGVATWEFSGRISQTNQVLFRVLWYDAEHQPCGETTVQIPAGEWMSVRPAIPLKPPGDALFLGFSLNLLHQQDGDWLEVRNISLTWRD